MNENQEQVLPLPILDGEFELGARLGQGSSGQVFEALQTSLGRTVAVKRLHKFGGGAGLDRFAIEAEIMARVAHPNIVPMVCYGWLAGSPALVMEKVDGQDLAAMLDAMRASPGPPSLAQWAHVLGAESLPWASGTPWWKIATSLSAQLARALDHAHRLGVLHHDLKPSNVLISRQGKALLADFGIARRLDGSADSVATDPLEPLASTSGNLAYCAPEEVQGHPATQASDLYSLGVMARELVSIESPYGEVSGAAARIFAIDRGRLAPVSRSLPRDLRAVLDRATALDPKARYRSSGDFARDLEAVVAGRAISIRPEGFLRRGRRWTKQNPMAAGLATVLGLLFIAVPASAQYTRLQSALRVQAAAALAQAHLGLALDGIERLLVEVGQDTLEGQPRLDLARTELLETGVTLCDDLEGTLTPHEATDLSRQIESVRVKGLLGLVRASCRLGDLDRAKAHLDRLQRAEAKLGQSMSDQDRRLLHARIQYLRMNLAQASKDLDAIETLGPELLPLLSDIQGTDEYLALMRASVWAAMIEAAIGHGDYEKAIQRGQEALTSIRKWVPTATSRATVLRELARVQGTYAAALIGAERFEEAETISREGLTLMEGLESAPHIQQLIAGHWNNLGAIERQRKDYASAELAERRAFQLQKAALGVSPHSERLRFEVARTRYRIALCLILPGVADPATDSEIRELLQAACAELQRIGAEADSTWEQQSVLATCAELLGNFELRAKNSLAAFQAFDLAVTGCEAAEKRWPGHPGMQGKRQVAWLRRVGIGLSIRPETGVEELDRYRSQFPNDPLVARNVASMLCLLAKKTRAGTILATKDPEQEAQALESLALDRLTEAVDLGGLELELLQSHPAWQALHPLPRFQALVARLDPGGIGGEASDR